MRLTKALIAVSLLSVFVGLPVIAVDKLPEASLKIPPLVPEQSVSTFIPSDSAPGQGLAVNVIYPKKPRYADGAPIVVVAPGGEGPTGLEFSTHAAQSGLAEVRFAFPGGGKPGFASSGVYDFRGPNCQAALRDVLLFAGGKIKDVQGQTIQKLVPAKLDTRNVGLIGWSNGGNIATITMAKHASQLGFVGWVVYYESPLGDMFYPASLGGSKDLFVNKHYRQGTAATGKPLIDYRKLAFEPKAQKNPGQHKKVGQPEIPGVLFFDENGNKEWEEEHEFAFPYSCDVGLDKQIYPPSVTMALYRTPGMAKDWPKGIATLAESQRYFHERDGSLYLNDMAKQLPHLLVCVFGSRLDHLQRQPDHPHIPLNYNSWLSNRMKFVRLNPDAVYVGAVSGMNSRTFIDNKPNSSIDASVIEEYLEPEGIVPDYVFIEAAVSELADRKKANNFKSVLEEPLVTYSNGAVVPTTATTPAAKPGATESTKTTTAKAAKPTLSSTSKPTK